MIRFVTTLAAAAAFATAASAQAPGTEASSMTCAQYLELQENDRTGILEGLFGGGEGETENETALEETADVSAEELAEACEGNDQMMISEAAQEARTD